MLLKTISKNDTWRLVRPVRLAHLAHITSSENQDATTGSGHSGRTGGNNLSPWMHLAQYLIFLNAPGATRNLSERTWRNT